MKTDPTHPDKTDKQNAAPQENTEATTTANTLLTIHQAAAFLRVGTRTIKNHERSGILRPVQCDSGESMYALEEVHEILRGKDRKRWKHVIEGDTTEWMTRGESASFLNCAPQTIKNYEKRGMLHPLRCHRRDARGHEQVVVIYDPEELKKLPKGVGRNLAPREATAVESRCFELFTQGKTIREVVIELRETSDRVRELHTKWLDDGDARTPAQEAKEIESRCFELFSQGKTVREIVIELRETSDRIRELREKWLDDGGADLVISNIAKEAFERLVGPFRDVTELLALVTEQLKNQTETQASRPT